MIRCKVALRLLLLLLLLLLLVLLLLLLLLILPLVLLDEFESFFEDKKMLWSNSGFFTDFQISS